MFTRRPAAACLALLGIASSVLVARGGLNTVVGCGIAHDPRPSQTAKDWVTQADHAVVATPVREQDTGRQEFTKGAVRYATDRMVTFRTDRVLWSTDAPQRTVGRTFDLVAAGWDVYRQDGRRVKRTTPHAPRLEPGHTYLLALAWSGEGWTVLGEGAAVPFDHHVAGQGEWCGRTLRKEDVALAERFSRSDDHSVEKTVLGQDESAVVRELRRARGE
ncbi:hypothetical protein ACIBBD_31190 [Streptomyces sp. NPDC051315]|uniref:hypothetical protein n=1 Tax=Streptomyces sp. NPDC051315 TaxID=3365650 RepID=UPI0037A3E8E3